MINNRIKDIRIENFIWIIYFFISISAIISNYYEEDFVKTNKINDFRIFKKINISIFLIAFFIYLYFVYFNYKNVTNLKKNSSKKKVLYANINLVASILFLVGGIFYLFTESTSDQLDENEVSFN